MNRRVILATLALVCALAAATFAEAAPIKLHGHVTTPATPPVYPAGVVSALAGGNDLRPVNDLGTSGAAGIQTAATKVPGVDTLPACVSMGTNSGEAYVEMTGSADCTLDGWNLTNFAVYAHLHGGAKATLTNDKLKYASTQAANGIHLIEGGYQNGGVADCSTNMQVVVQYNELDGTGAYDFREALLEFGNRDCAQTISLKFWNNNVHDFPRDVITWSAHGAQDVQLNFFDGFARSPTNQAHWEIDHNYSNNLTFKNNLIDLTKMASINYLAVCDCRATALIYNATGIATTADPNATFSDDTVAVIQNNVVKGAAALAAQAGSTGFVLPTIWESGHSSALTNVSQTVTGNVTDKGSNAYQITNASGNAKTSTFTDGGGNYQYSVGVPAPLP